MDNDIPIVIVDLDGTLADNSERKRKYIDNRKEKDWRRFYATSGTDIYPSQRSAFIRLLSQNCALWFWTNRPHDYREQTRKDILTRVFLKMPPPFPFKVSTRKNDDHRPEYEIREEWLDSLDPVTLSRVIMVIDDRKKNAKLYKEYGLPCAILEHLCIGQKPTTKEPL